MRIVATLLLAIISVPALAQNVVPGVVVVADEDSVAIPGGGMGRITTLNIPFSDASDRVGFTGGILIDGVAKHYVWYDTGVIWHSDMGLPTVLSGAENWMGVGNAGEFVYSPSIDASAGGGDGIWTDQGEVVHDDDPAPGIAGQFIVFGSRPTMLPNGTAYWISGISDVVGGSTDFDVLYRSADRTTAGATPFFRGDGMIGAEAIDDVGFDYWVSDNDMHHILTVSLAGSTTSDDIILLDSVVIARELSPTGDGDNWDNLDLVRVNNGGVAVHSGDTDGPTTGDEYIAVGTDIVLREGQTVGTVTLGTTVRGLALRNDGFVVWAWTTSAGTADEAMFIGQASDLAASSVLYLRTGDGLDTTGDMVSDYTVVDFEFTDTDGQGAFDFTDGTFLYTTLELAPVGGGANIIAQVGLDFSAFLPTAGAPTPAAGDVALAVSPNPFGESARISLTLPAAEEALVVEVLDVLGRRVAVIHDGAMTAGSATLEFDASLLEAGVYVVRAAAGTWSVTERITRF